VALEDGAEPPRTLHAPLLAMNRTLCNKSRVTERTAALISLRLIDGLPVAF